MVLTRENYYSPEANREYMSVSLYKEFAGTYGRRGCEARAIAICKGEFVEEPSDAMLIGSYVDAWAEGEDEFRAFRRATGSMIKSDGTLYSKYAAADRIIERIRRDKFFMRMLSGQHQVIMTGELFGAKWKIRMDSFHPDKMIVDLKTAKSLREAKWVKDGSPMNFAEYWGYDIQGAIYQEIVKQNTGKRLPFFLAAASKEAEVDIDVFKISQGTLDAALDYVWSQMPRINRLRSGEEVPDRCELCTYCRRSRVLTGYHDLDEIVLQI